jgi:hypothetical protein
MNNWKTALLNTGGRRNGRKGNNRGMMWASLLGLGVSAAVYGLRRNRNMMRPVQNAMNNIRTRTAGSSTQYKFYKKQINISPQKNVHIKWAFFCGEIRLSKLQNKFFYGHGINYIYQLKI